MSETFTQRFGKELKFRQLYSLLKNRKEYKWNRQIPHESCVCEICENIRLFTQAINRKVRDVDKKLDTDPKSIVLQYGCDHEAIECMSGSCDACPVPSLEKSDFVDSDNDSDSDPDAEENGNKLKYYQWASVEGKSQKVLLTAELSDIPDTLKNKIDELKYHHFVKNQQYNVYSSLKAELPLNSILMHVDYSEGYDNKNQDECQASYFGHAQFSIFRACVYVPSAEGVLQKE